MKRMLRVAHIFLFYLMKNTVRPQSSGDEDARRILHKIKNIILKNQIPE